MPSRSRPALVSRAILATESTTYTQQVRDHFFMSVLFQRSFCFGQEAKITETALVATRRLMIAFSEPLCAIARLVTLKLGSDTLEGLPVPCHALVHCLRALWDWIEAGRLQAEHDDAHLGSFADRLTT